MLGLGDMTAATHGPLRILPGARHPRAARAGDWLLPRALAALVVAALVGVLFQASSERRALQALPAERRAALLARTVEELSLTCGAGRPDALRNHCRELASFAGQFDECRGDCEVVVRRELAPAPTR
jgi:hypothetical protein